MEEEEIEEESDMEEEETPEPAHKGKKNKGPAGKGIKGGAEGNPAECQQQWRNIMLQQVIPWFYELSLLSYSFDITLNFRWQAFRIIFILPLTSLKLQRSFVLSFSFLDN